MILIKFFIFVMLIICEAHAFVKDQKFIFYNDKESIFDQETCSSVPMAFFIKVKDYRKCAGKKDYKCLLDRFPDEAINRVYGMMEGTSQEIIKKYKLENRRNELLGTDYFPDMPKEEKMSEYLPLFIDYFFQEGKVQSCWIPSISPGGVKQKWMRIRVKGTGNNEESLLLYVDLSSGEFYFFPDDKFLKK